MTDLQAMLEAHQRTRLLRMSFPRNDGPQATLMVNRFVGTKERLLEMGLDSRISVGAGEECKKRSENRRDYFS